MKTVFILRGLPGSGKSTLAKTLESMHVKAISISLDDFIAIDGEFKTDRMKAYAQFNFDRFAIAVERKVPVIIYHNVNAQGWQWRKYKEFAEQAGYTVFVLIVENCHNGKSEKEIPQAQLDDLKSKFNIHL